MRYRVLFELLNTIIVSDGWRVYSSLKKHNYIHKVINHSVEFVNSEDPTIHTQTIERL